MPAAPIPFVDGQASGIEELAGASPAVINMIHDGASARTRPGLSTWAAFPAVAPDASPVIGIWIFGAYVVYCTADRKLWALLAPGLVVPLSDNTLPTQLDGSKRPMAVVTLTRIVIIGGGVPQKWEGVGLSARLGGNPPSGTAIGAIALRLVIGGNNTGNFYWSEMFDVGHEVWNSGSAGQADTSAAPDRLVSLVTTVGELYALGTETMQVFIPDPTAGAQNTIFTAGTTVEIGSLAPGSLIKNDAQICFLDHRRRIVATDGRSVQDLTDQGMAKTLQKFVTISDCWSFRARFDAVDLLGFVFPTEGRMLVFNSAVKKWTEWRSIDGDGRWQPWVGQSHCFWPDRNLHLIGLEDGTISLLDPAAFTERGAMLKALVRTGFGDRGTGNRKVCERVQFLMRRGNNANTTAPVAQLRWRNDLGVFGQPLRVSLGAPGDYEAIVNKWTLGVYTTRQWEVSMTDPAEFVLVAVEEVYTPLEA